MKYFNVFFLVMIIILSINAFPRAGNDFPGLRITNSKILLKVGEKKLKIKEVDMDETDYDIRLVINPTDIIVKPVQKYNSKLLK